MSELTKALLKAQGAFPAIKKDATAGKEGGFTYKYATLGNIYRSVRKPLADAGLVLSHTLQNGSVTARLLHISGESVESSIEIGQTKDWKDLGKAITYSTRYAVCGLLGICPDDDVDAPQAPRQPRQSRQPARAARPAKPGPATRFGLWNAGL